MHHARASQHPDGQANMFSAELHHKGNLERLKLHQPHWRCSMTSEEMSVNHQRGQYPHRGPDIYGRLSWRNPPERFCFWQTVQTCIREEKSLFRTSRAKGIIAHPNEGINKVHRGIQSSGKQLIMRMQSLRLDSYTKTCQPGLTLKLFL